MNYRDEKRFEFWYENADMPRKDKNGKWYDLEDGLYFSDFCEKEEKIKRVSKVDVKRKELDELILKIKKMDWKSLSQDKKNELYDLIRKRKEMGNAKQKNQI